MASSIRSRDQDADQNADIAVGRAGEVETPAEESDKRTDPSARKERKHRSRTDKERDPNRTHRPKRERKIDPVTGEVIRHRKKKREEDRERERGRRDSKRAQHEAHVTETQQGESAPSHTLPSRRHSSAMSADVVPELSKTATAKLNSSRTSLPYPSLARAYSKEAVYSRDDVRLASKTSTLYTPNATDVEAAQTQQTKPEEVTRDDVGRSHERPPSPPETDFSSRGRGSSASKKPKVKLGDTEQSGSPKPSKAEDDEPRPGIRRAKTSKEEDNASRPSPRRSRTTKVGDGEPPSPRRSNTPHNVEAQAPSQHAKTDDVEESRLSSRSKSSQASTAFRSEAPAQSTGKKYSLHSMGQTRATPGNNMASTLPTRGILRSKTSKSVMVDTDSSPASAQDSSPQTPTQVSQLPYGSKSNLTSMASSLNYKPVSPRNKANIVDSPLPPPPPPPPHLPQSVPQVDYVLHNGGLSTPVPKGLLPSYSPPVGVRPHKIATSQLIEIFSPFQDVLTQYETILHRHGSLAVATGYRSMAQRLQEKLEVVLDHEPPQEKCTCIICVSSSTTPVLDLNYTWARLLEMVAGKGDLPVWPAFDFNAHLMELNDAEAIANTQRPSSPIKLDPDIAPEFREHYLQQTAKTKTAVSRWLSSCPSSTTTLPTQEVDEDTLTFAIITHLTPSERIIFNALIAGSSTTSNSSRLSSTTRKLPRSDFMIRSAAALQRLYRLNLPPKDAEIAIYLLRNPSTHDLVATVSSIGPQDWEVLTSGRFDDYMWSMSDNSHETSRTSTPFRSPSAPRHSTRATTPLQRGQTPVRQPVTTDEETEIAVLAEVEREIYTSMEALEDAFEALHRKAEGVRRALRERGAGLSMSLEHRRTMIFPSAIATTTEGESESEGGGGHGGDDGEGTGLGLGIRHDGRKHHGHTHRHGHSGGGEAWDGANDDLMSELMPDDSASNISSSRHRRPKRRTERRTPAPVEEEDEHE